jgi:hypothetical protein
MFAAFIPALVGALGAAMATFAGRVFLALGFGTITYTGITAGIAAIKSQVVSGITGMPADAVGLIGYLWIDKGLTVIFSAIAAALTLRTVAGSLKKVVMK